MVIESLIRPVYAEHRPWLLFFFGFFFASIGVLMALWIFRAHAGLVMIFLTVIAALPLVRSLIKFESSKEISTKDELALLTEHSKALLAFLFLFLGATVAFAAWYIFLPAELSSSMFALQTETITSLNKHVTGSFILGGSSLFGKIFFNNIKVLIFCILFSFIYGSGAIFILMWNASVIGVALGNFIRINITQYASLLQFDRFASYFYIVSLGIARYAIHGIPEILAYFIAGLAGGLISIAVLRHDFSSQEFFRTLLDVSDLLLISIFVLLLAALLEVYVTPFFFFSLSS